MWQLSRIIKLGAYWPLRIMLATFNVLCIIIGAYIIFFQLSQFSHIDLRVEENTEAANEVTKLGLFVESHFLRTGQIPSLKEFNCPAPCKSNVYIITHEAWKSKSGVIHVKYFKPGLAFTPLSQFNIYWNSVDRATDREIQKNRWFWMLAPIPWLAVGIALITLPFFIRRIFRHLSAFFCKIAYQKSKERMF